MAIPNQTVTTHHLGSVIEDIQMSMRAEDFPHIASLLTNLYSDPIAAVEREYATNAWDSHVAAGQTRPIEVTLPSPESLEFVVQDFGLGLSVDDLRDVYSMYGRSLKRESNDFAGQLGLGCKSGLTYAEAFTIVAVKNGIKTVAMSTKDEHGVGVIKVLDTLGTDEPNGVRITIPVDRYDVYNFAEAAKRLFQFWEPGSVLVNGEAPEVCDWRSTALELDEHTWLVRKDAGLHQSYVIMGNVPYPVPDADIGNRETMRFVATLNIGDVDFVPSREAVHHTRHTDATLTELADYIKANYKRALASAYGNATSRWEETMLKVLWMDRGLVLKSDTGHPIWHYEPSGYGKQAYSKFRYPLRNLAASPSLVVITDFPAKNVSPSARERLRTFIGDSIKSPSFVIIPDVVAGIGQLEGRPNTYSWTEIVGATEVAKADKPKVKREKSETRYGTTSGTPYTADELAALGGKVLYLNPGESALYGNLDATVVHLRSANQLPRIKRFVPNIKHYDEEVLIYKKAAAAAITPLDRRIVQARSLADVFAEMDPTLVDDPELSQAIMLRKADDSDAIKEARKFGVVIGNASQSLPNFAERYPLVRSRYYGLDNDQKADGLLYVNAKWAQIQAQLGLDSKAS